MNNLYIGNNSYIWTIYILTTRQKRRFLYFPRRMILHLFATLFSLDTQSVKVETKHCALLCSAFFVSVFLLFVCCMQ